MEITTAAHNAASINIAPTEEGDADACCARQGALGTDDGALDTERAPAIVERLKALADPTRLRVLDLLAQHGKPLCVCEITEQFALQQPTISHHVRILRQAGLIDGEKRGVWSYYWATEAGRQSVTLVKALL